MLDNPHFLDELIVAIEEGVQSYTQAAYTQLVATLGPVWIALVTLYIVLQGIKLYLGQGDHTPLSFVRQVLTLGFISLLAMNWDWFVILVVNFVTHTPDALIGSLIPNNLGEEGVKGFFTYFFDESLAVFIELFQEGGWKNLSAYLIGFVGGIAVLILTVAIFLLLVSSEILLAVLLVLAPFIIPLYLFSTSRQICIAWVRMLVSTMFIPILVFAISGLFTDILNTQLEKIKSDEIDYYDWAAYLTIVVISTLLIRVVPTLSIGMGNGVTYATSGGNPATALRFATRNFSLGMQKLYDMTVGRVGNKSKSSSQQHSQQQTSAMTEDRTELSSSVLILPSRLSGYGGKSL